MEAVAANIVILEVLGRNGVTVGLGGHGHVESGVKHGNLGGVGHNRLAGTDAHQVCGVMQRAQGDALFNGLDDLIIDDAGVGELHAAVEHAVTNGIDLVNRLDHTINRIDQDLQNSLNRLGMAGHGNVLYNLLVPHLMGQAAIDINTLTQALGGNIAGFGIHQLVLQGRTASIDNQNVHWNLLLKIMFSFSENCGMITMILYFIFPVFSTPNRKIFSKRSRNFGYHWNNLRIQPLSPGPYKPNRPHPGTVWRRLFHSVSDERKLCAKGGTGRI